MAISDIYRLAVVGQGAQGQALVNVFHYRQETGTIVQDPGRDLADAWVANVQTAFLATFAGGAALHMLQIRGITDPTYGFDFDIAGHPVGTAGTGEELPPQDSAVITWKTGKIGRSFRGRTYCWPMPESAQQRGLLVAGYASALAAFAEEAMTIGDNVTTALWRMVVLSLYADKVKRPAPLATPVTEAVVRNVVNTQQRRKQGIGA